MSYMKIKCQDCKREFIFTESEQDFYEKLGFIPPRRCKTCRQKRKNNINNIDNTERREK